MALVSYSDTEDEDEVIQVTTTSIPLVSVDSDSAALIKPQPTSLKKNKEICPLNVCKMKRPNKRTWWVQCSVEECGQWFHQRCVGITKEAARRDIYTCPDCIQ